MKKFLILAFLFFAFPFAILAHQPRIVEGNSIIEIKNPDVSQAFYGNLEGKPQEFSFNLNDKQDIYFNLLVPDLPNIGKNIFLKITGPDYFYYFLDGTTFNWAPFYEEFAGDKYFKGPEAKISLEAGKYNLEVFSPTGKGKYVLVVGEKEEFPPKEILNALYLLPEIKTGFFGKSFLTVYFNKIGLYFLLPIVIILIAVILLTIFLIRYYKKKKSQIPWVLK